MTASAMPKKAEAPPIPDEVCVAAIETLLKPLGTSLRHYMPLSKADAIEAMRGVLMAERERAAGIIDAANTHYADMHEAAKLTKNRAEVRDIQSMRIATAGLGAIIRGERQ